MAQSIGYLATAVNIYAFICFIRLILSWFPSVNNTQGMRIISGITDPYLNLFRRLRFLQFHGIDFSATLALCVLFALATVLSSLASGQALTVGYFLTIIVSLVWSFISATIKFIIALLIIRLVVFVIMRLASRNKGYRSYSPVWDQIDRFITPFIYKISSIFIKRVISFTTALAVACAVLIIGVIIADRLIALLCFVLSNLPF